MSIKELSFRDDVTLLDEKEMFITSSKSPKFKTEIIATNELGEHLFTEHNELLLSGGLFLMEKLTNVNAPINITTMNTDMNILASETNPGFMGPRRESRIFGFSVGVSGCTDVFDTVKDVKYKQRKIETMVPFRRVELTSDLSSAEKAKYGMRKTDAGFAEYYIKRFETEPDIRAEFDEPGAPSVPANVDTSPDNKVINTYMQFTLKISKDDIREYFKTIGGGLNKARINTLGLVYGYPDTSQGYTEYKGVRYFSLLNFNNEALDNETKEINIIYKIYI